MCKGDSKQGARTERRRSRSDSVGYAFKGGCKAAFEAVESREQG